MKLRISLTLIILSLVFLGGFAKYYGFSKDELLSFSFYKSLANPSVRIVRIQEGVRQEQVAETVAKNLGWNEEMKEEFLNGHVAYDTASLEGKYFPKTYLLNKDLDAIGVTNTMIHEFNDQTENLQRAKSTQVVNEDTIIKIASLIQREAAGKQDMNLISGIIWNRIFKGMKLQVDATLQYAKGDEENWWPKVVPSDKKIESPYNTYLYTDLPPTPIANPGLAAIKAAANPQKTTCLFYIHDKNRQIHCSATYAQHMKNIAKYY